MGEFPHGLPDNAFDVREGRCTINGKEDVYYSYKTISSAVTRTSYKLPIDPNASATPGFTVEKRLKRFGDLLIDQDTGERIPLRKLTKEQRKKYE